MKRAPSRRTAAIGDATVVASGNITVTANAGLGTTQYGLLAHAGDPTISGALGAGNASVTYNSGTIDVSAVRPRGILAWVDGNGSATVTTEAGTVINVSGTQFGGPGVLSSFRAARPPRPNALTANVASTNHECRTGDHRSPVIYRSVFGPLKGTDAPIYRELHRPGHYNQGGNGIGILALASGSGSINGDFLRADHDKRLKRSRHRCRQRQLDANVTVTASGAITTQGAESHGIWATSTTGTVQVNAINNVSTTGQFSTGINAISSGFRTGGNVAVNVAPGGSVMGGWQADLTGVGSHAFRSTGRRRYPGLDRRHRDPDQ